MYNIVKHGVCVKHGLRVYTSALCDPMVMRERFGAVGVSIFLTYIPNGEPVVATASFPAIF